MVVVMNDIHDIMVVVVMVVLEMMTYYNRPQ